MSDYNARNQGIFRFGSTIAYESRSILRDDNQLVVEGRLCPLFLNLYTFTVIIREPYLALSYNLQCISVVQSSLSDDVHCKSCKVKIVNIYAADLLNKRRFLSLR